MNLRTLRRLLWRLQRALLSAWGVVVTLATLSLIRMGWFEDVRSERAGMGALVVVGLLAVLVLIKVYERVRHGGHQVTRRGQVIDDEARAAERDVHLGAALIVATYVLISMSGGLHSPLYPLVYAMVASMVAFNRKIVAVVLVGLVFCVEFLLFRSQGATPKLMPAFVSHCTFIGFFSLVYLVFLQSEILRLRREQRRSLQREVQALRQEARDFRLISSSLAHNPQGRTREQDEERLAIGAVETIHVTLFYTLELLKKSLELHTCVLLWLDESGEYLKIKELVTDSDCIAEVPLAVDAGALGTVVKNRLMVNLRDPKRGHLPYYSGPEEVDSFIGVPVMEDGHLRGVLCADRYGHRPFSAQDEALLKGAAAQLNRAIQSERVFAAVERSKYEHERLFAALARLNRALTAKQVCDMTFEAVGEICKFDFGAITLFDPVSKQHTVVSSVGEAPKGFESGFAFSDNAGIAAMVVKNKHFLPAGGELRDKDVTIFTKKMRMKSMDSLLVLPLISADEAVGSFTIAAKRPRAFGKERREMLAMIANHVAVSIMNAQLYGRMEQMATTDGLTGLSNHRTFQERVVEMLARAERSNGRLSLMLTDIDHFKKVNDTYGHPIGDVVLKGVAQVVRECVRKVDVAARYGGEEFAIVLEGTELSGARLLAERIRSEVQRQVFQGPTGPFSVTLSLGIASYPDDGRDAKTLIGEADQALYHAKRSGRNRAVAFVELAKKVA